ncbi:MAG: diadenylate cyclase [Myxococcota bacterium]
MLEGLKQLVTFDRPTWEIVRDFADVLIVAFIAYRALLVMKGTRAMQISLGIGIFALLYLIAQYAELATLMSVLSWLASSAILIVVVVFQPDIRRALIRVGSKAWLARGRDAKERLLSAVVDASTELARHRMGAIICLERDANVLEFVQKEGVELDALVSHELLVSLFIPEAQNKVHDGAVLIRDNRITRAGLLFNMPEAGKGLDPAWGSRHQAAMGIAAETDAVVVVVSEERGAITVFFGSTFVPQLNANSLREALVGLFEGELKKTSRGWFTRSSEPKPRSTIPPAGDEPPKSARPTPASAKASASIRASSSKTSPAKGDLSAAKTTLKSATNLTGTTPRSPHPSGGYEAIKRDVPKQQESSPHENGHKLRRDADSTAASISAVSEVSVPMKKAELIDANLDDSLPEEDSVEPALDDTPTEAIPSSVTKPMMPTELHRTTLAPEEP